MQGTLFGSLEINNELPPMLISDQTNSIEPVSVISEKIKNEVVSVKPKAKKPIAESTPFVSEKQREIVCNHPLRGLFLGKGLEAVAPSDQPLFPEPTTGNILKHLNYSTKWDEIATSFLAVLVEKEYKAVDERFIHNQTGNFQIIGEDGKLFDINYTYKPNYHENPQRLAFPSHHLYFVSDGRNPLTETGYLSHFFHYVPYDKVRSFEEFLLYVMRVDLELELPVIINGVTYTEPNFGESGA